MFPKCPDQENWGLSPVCKKAGVIAVETFTKEPAEKVDAELINKVLETE